MRKIQTTNISFRATENLKRKLTNFCVENDLHNSIVIRQALAVYLRRLAVPEPQAETKQLMVQIAIRDG
jgi:predicted transcriptional regulator